MNDEKINCPRCNAEHKFKKRFRAAGARPWFEVYLRCPTCRWEKVLGTTTNEIETTKKQITVVIKQIARAEFMHGQASESMLNLERRLTARLHDQERKLRIEVESYGSSD